MKNILILTLFSLFISILQAQNLPEAPATYTAVNDFADFLTEEEEQLLSTTLNTYEDSTSTQIVIVTIESLEEITVEEYANLLFESWGIGQKGINNGVLLLLAKAERKIRIEVGYGVEDKLTDLETGRIVNNNMTPELKEGNFYKAFSFAVNKIIEELGEEFKEEQHRVTPFSYEYEEGDQKDQNQKKRTALNIILLCCALILQALIFFNSSLKRKHIWHIAFALLAILGYLLIAFTSYFIQLDEDKGTNITAIFFGVIPLVLLYFIVFYDNKKYAKYYKAAFICWTLGFFFGPIFNFAAAVAGHDIIPWDTFFVILVIGITIFNLLVFLIMALSGTKVDLSGLKEVRTYSSESKLMSWFKKTWDSPSSEEDEEEEKSSWAQKNEEKHRKKMKKLLEKRELKKKPKTYSKGSNYRTKKYKKTKKSSYKSSYKDSSSSSWGGGSSGGGGASGSW